MTSSSPQVTPAQATAIMDALERKYPKGDVDDAKLKAILKEQGVQFDKLIIKIDKRMKPPMLYLLTPTDAAQAGIAVSDPGVPNDPKTKAK